MLPDRSFLRATSLALLVLALPGAALAQTIRLVPASSGNEVRYVVKEQLAGFNLPNDAVGSTSDVSGALVFDAEGRVVRGESGFTVNLVGLTSDQNMRDNFLRRRTFETEQHPTATLVPSAVNGLPWPLPSSGTFSFTLLADLTFKGETHPTVWEVTAEAAGGGFRGSAKTSFSFAAIDLAKPRVARVLSVDDTIRLEYDFNLIPSYSLIR